MLLMVTNRRIMNGRYGDEEKRKNKYDYLYDYNGKQQGKDGFDKIGKKGFETALLDELDRIKKEETTNTPKVGIYIHGYNTDYRDSIDTLFDFEKNLTNLCGYSPVIVGFSWPSSGAVTHYLSDREEVRDSIGAFTRFLLDIDELARRNEQDCFSSTFCIAHSMGNYLLRKGMEYLSDYLGNPRGRMLFDETIMMAPDLSSNDIESDGKGRYIADFSRRVHVYYSKFDRALKASSTKRFGSNRLGRHGANNYENLPSNVVVVDAKKYANSDSLSGYTNRSGGQVSVHSACKHHKNILSDVVQVLSSIDRDQIENRECAESSEGVLMNNHYRLM